MPWAWLIFLAFVLFMLALDLGVFHRKDHEISMKEALAWSAVWVTLGLSFTVFIYFGYEYGWLGLGSVRDVVNGGANDGYTAAVKYVTGYIIEKSLSVDNIFVIALIFRYFAVPARYQHRVLFWGILGALVMRGAMIGIGAKLVAEFHWILYVFGVFLVFAAVKMLYMKDEAVEPGQNAVLRLVHRFFPVTDRFHGHHFMVRAGSDASHEKEVPEGPSLQDERVERTAAGTLMVTPLALALVMVETTDLLFAVDSIPAIFAITADPYLVFTSNVFAILGLRSLYFALAGLMDKFRYLKVSLALVLLLVGVKMLVADWIKDLLGENYNLYLLGVIVFILGAGVAASVAVGPKKKHLEAARAVREAGEGTKS